MRRAAVLLALLALPAAAAIQRQAHAYGTGSSFTPITATLSNCATNRGYLIVLLVTDYGHDVTTDTISSTSIPSGWSHGSNSTSSTQENVAIWWAYSASVSNAETVTVTNGQYPAFFAACYSGTASSPLDQQSVGPSQPGSVTPPQNNELIVTGSGNENTSSAPTVNDGFSISDAIPESSGHYVGGGMADLVQTAAAAINPTWTETGGTPATAIMTFKAAAAVASGGGFVIVM
jgi:hypothetical protein